MFDFRRIVLLLIVLAIAIPMVSAQEGPDNLPFNCRITATPPIVRAEGVAELAGDILISCSGLVPNQGIDPATGLIRDLRGNVTVRATVPITSQAVSAISGVNPDINGRILTDALIINSGYQVGRCNNSATIPVVSGLYACPNPQLPSTAATVGQIGQPAPYVSGAPIYEFPYAVTINNHGKYNAIDPLGALLEWDDVLFAPGSAAGKQWYMQLRITNIRVNAFAAGPIPFAPAIDATVTINTQVGNVTTGPDTVTIARPRPSFRIETEPVTRRNCDDPKSLTMNLDIIELLPNAFKPRIDDEVNVPLCAGVGDQCDPNSAYFTESGLMLDNVWAGNAPNIGNTGVATQGTQFNIRILSPISLDPGGSTPYSVSVGAGDDPAVAPPTQELTSSAGVSLGSSIVGTDRARDFRIEVTNFNLNADPFVINRLRVPITANYNEQLFGQTTVQVWYLPQAAADEFQVKIGAPVPRFAPEIKTADGYAVVRCRTLLLFPYVTNRNGFNTGIAIANTSQDTGPFASNGGASPQQGPCRLFMYGGKGGNGNPVPGPLPLDSTVNVPAGGLYIGTLQTGFLVYDPTGQQTVATSTTDAAGFEGYVIASCEFQYAHGYAFISDTAVQRVAQGYLALIIPDRLDFEEGLESRPASPFNLGPSALLGGEQLVH